MWATACLLLGIVLACEPPDLPPSPKAAAFRPSPFRLSARAPKGQPANLQIATRFDPACPARPPRRLQRHFVAAARRYPLGADSCQLARQAFAESGFDVNARNERSGALGIAQFLPSTAAHLGIDPLNPAQAVMGQARYLLWCRGQWTPNLAGRTGADIEALGLGCYNWGLGNMLADQERNGWVTYYQQARPHMPRETREYVRKIREE